MNYDKFLSLPKPQKEWEAWCLLYCKLRIFELFSGDRVTQRGERSGEKEYICLNYDKDQLGEGWRYHFRLRYLNLSRPILMMSCERRNRWI